MTKQESKQLTKEPMYRYLLLLAVAAAIGLQGWRTMFNNFAVDSVGIDGLQVGIIQSVREIPGFLSLLVIFVLLFVKEHKLAAFSIIVLGVGVALTGWLPSFVGLIFSTLIMSLGFHYFETTNQSLSLQYFSHKTTPIVLARIRSLSAATNIAVGMAIWALSAWLDFATNYSLLGMVVIAIGLYALRQQPTKADLPIQHKKMILRRRYWLYYVLNFLSGARRQVFVVFAVFMLVEKYAFSVQAISLLFVLNNIVAYFFNPLIAKGINKFGERSMLTMEYGSLILIFTAYATIDVGWVVALLYILDHIFFNFSIGIRTYFQKHADPQDIAPSMAVGFTINHITAVVIPVLGGLMWLHNWRLPFIMGVALAACSLFFVLRYMKR